ncbi:MAG: tRNA lysidine(34) synthetase TilS [Clostridiales bacterium]|nr:tRNA lysidine(34) synthetase TilS [Clostridiales bacterium]
MEFKTRILNTVKERELFTDGDHLVLGLSGGPDSLSLYNALKELREDNLRTGGKFGLSFSVHPVHVNHKFRPGAAEEDQAFCEELCKVVSERVEGFHPLRSFTVDCNALAAELGMTSEEAGRKARYDAFRTVGRDVMEFYGCGADRIKILVAQNADDQAETILFRILRGTGPDGLGGIAYKREDESGFQVVRPILDIARDDIEKYCEEKGLEPRRDHTNEEALYARNKIRLELLPLLRKEYNPNITETLNRLGRLAAEDKGYIYEKAAEAYEEVRSGEHSLDIRKLKDLPPSVKKRVYMLALSGIGMRENVTEKHLKAVEAVANSQNHKAAVAELTGGFRVTRIRHDLIFYREDEK